MTNKTNMREYMRSFLEQSEEDQYDEKDLPKFKDDVEKMPEPSQEEEPPSEDEDMSVDLDSEEQGAPSETPPSEEEKQVDDILGGEDLEPEELDMGDFDPLTAAISEYMEILKKSPDDKQALESFLKMNAGKDSASSFRTFISSNLSAVSLLEETVIKESQKVIRRGKSAEDMVANLESELTGRNEYKECVQRISALGGNRGNAWRQLIAAMCGGVIVPGPVGSEVHIPIGRKKNAESLILRPQAYLGWGAIDLGRVIITSDSSREYLGSEEQSKLIGGAPEEKRVLRNRMVIEAICDQLGNGIYAILVVSEEGPWQTAYFDSEMFREAYEAGILTVIEPHTEPGSTIAFNSDGEPVELVSWGLASIDKEDSTINPSTGEKVYEAIQIGESKGERLLFVGDSGHLSEVGANVYDHSMDFEKEELLSIRHSVPSARETIMGKRT
jgi:hypothetical protein